MAGGKAHGARGACRIAAGSAGEICAVALRPARAFAGKAPRVRGGCTRAARCIESAAAAGAAGNVPPASCPATREPADRLGHREAAERSGKTRLLDPQAAARVLGYARTAETACESRGRTREKIARCDDGRPGRCPHRADRGRRVVHLLPRYGGEVSGRGSRRQNCRHQRSADTRTVRRQGHREKNHASTGDTCTEEAADSTEKSGAEKSGKTSASHARSSAGTCSSYAGCPGSAACDKIIRHSPGARSSAVKSPKRLR